MILRELTSKHKGRFEFEFHRSVVKAGLEAESLFVHNNFGCWMLHIVPQKYNYKLTELRRETYFWIDALLSLSYALVTIIIFINLQPNLVTQKAQFETAMLCNNSLNTFRGLSVSVRKLRREHQQYIVMVSFSFFFADSSARQKHYRKARRKEWEIHEKWK